ncbi:MAG TPA: formate dehydrogenase accessory sulfurtransferase FdhD [Vicinamibacterales bacterium]
MHTASSANAGAPGIREVTLSRSDSPADQASGQRARERDLVAVEEPMEVRVNGASFAVIMRTPGADRDLAAGFLLAEDVIRHVDEVGAIEYCNRSEPSAPAAAPDVTDEGRDNTINVTVLGDAIERLDARLGQRRQVMMTASCGLCGRLTIESLQARVSAVRGEWTVEAGVIAALPDRLRSSQSVFESTGGLHAAGLFDRAGKLRLSAEDVGRHNAVDKITGRTLLAGLHPLDASILLVSGRTSFELVQKALLAGVPIIAAVSAPSSLAIELAEQSGITLCGFLRGERFNIYTHPQRIV